MDSKDLNWAGPDVRTILGRALDGEELTVAEGIRLTEVEGRDYHALCLVADEMRRRQAGEIVTCHAMTAFPAGSADDCGAATRVKPSARTARSMRARTPG